MHVTQLPHDFYHFDPIRKTLTGERRGREFRLGDRVRIVVLKASVEERKIDFRLVEEDGGAADAGAAGRAASRRSGRRRSTERATRCAGAERPGPAIRPKWPRPDGCIPQLRSVRGLAPHTIAA